MQKISYILSALFAIYYIFIFSYTVDPKLDLNGDNATYIELARNIADGHGYKHINTYGDTTPASHFPPGYSTILSVAIMLGIKSLMGWKILNGIFLFISVTVLAFMVKKLTGQTYLAFGIAILTVLCPTLMHFAGIVMSEMSYMLCTVISLFALYMYDMKSPEKRYGFLSSPWFYLAAVMAVGAYHIRTVGASIMFAIVIFYLFRKEWIAAAGSTVLMALLMIPWMLRNSLYGLKSRYLDTVMVVNPWRPEEGNISSFGEMIQKMLVNIDETVIKGFKEMLFPFIELNYQQTSGFMSVAGSVLIVAIIFYGAWSLKNIRWATIAFLIANIGLFALWHGGNGARYVTPIVPVLFVCFYTGIYALLQLAVKNKIKHDAPYLLVILLMALPMIPPIKEQHKTANAPYPVPYQQYFAIAEELQKQAPAGTVVCCRKPELFKYYAPSLHTTRYVFSTDADEVLQDMTQKKVDYVVLDQLGYSSTPRYLYPAITARQKYFSTVWHLKNPDCFLLRFDRKAYADIK